MGTGMASQGGTIGLKPVVPLRNDDDVDEDEEQSEEGEEVVEEDDDDPLALSENDMDLVWDLLLYLIFLGLFTVVTLFVRDSGAGYVFVQMSRDVFDGSEFSTNNGFVFEKFFEGIVTFGDAWGWLEGPLLDGLYQTAWYNGNQFNLSSVDSEMGQFLHFNSVIGGIRLRQLRSKTVEPCPVPQTQAFIKAFKKCNLHYSQDNEARSDYGPGIANPENTFSIGSMKGKPAIFRWQSMEELKSSTTVVGDTVYWGGGYVHDLPSPRLNPNNFTGNVSAFEAAGLNYTIRDEAAGHIAMLKAAKWFDTSTRALLVDFNTYNPHINMFQVNRMVLEFPVSGGATPHAFIRAVRLWRYRTMEEWVVFGLEIMFFSMVLYYLFVEARKFCCCKCKNCFCKCCKCHQYSEGPARYCKGICTDMWRIIDFVNLSVFVIVICMRISTQMFILTVDPDPSQQGYVDLQYAARLELQEKNFNAFNGMLCWIKSLKYLSIQKDVKMYTYTLSSAKSAMVLTLFCMGIM